MNQLSNMASDINALKDITVRYNRSKNHTFSMDWLSVLHFDYNTPIVSSDTVVYNKFIVKINEYLDGVRVAFLNKDKVSISETNKECINYLMAISNSVNTQMFELADTKFDDIIISSYKTNNVNFGLPETRPGNISSTLSDTALTSFIDMANKIDGTIITRMDVSRFLLTKIEDVLIRTEYWTVTVLDKLIKETTHAPTLILLNTAKKHNQFIACNTLFNGPDNTCTIAKEGVVPTPRPSFTNPISSVCSSFMTLLNNEYFKRSNSSTPGKFNPYTLSEANVIMFENAVNSHNSVIETIANIKLKKDEIDKLMLNVDINPNPNTTGMIHNSLTKIQKMYKFQLIFLNLLIRGRLNTTLRHFKVSPHLNYLILTIYNISTIVLDYYNEVLTFSAAAGTADTETTRFKNQALSSTLDIAKTLSNNVKQNATAATTNYNSALTRKDHMKRIINSIKTSKLVIVEKSKNVINYPDYPTERITIINSIFDINLNIMEANVTAAETSKNNAEQSLAQFNSFIAAETAKITTPARTTPGPTTPAPTTPAPTTPARTTPAPTTPAPTTPARTTPAPTTPAPTTPAPTTPAPTTPARTTPAPTTPARTTPAPTTPAPTTPAPTTPASTTAYSTTPASTTPAATTPAWTTAFATTPASTTPARTTAYSTTAQPVFPRMTFKTIDMGNGQHMFVNEPYQKCDFFTVSFTVSAFSGINSIFEIWSYHTNTYDHFNKSMIKLVNITSTGEYTFTQQNPTPERYNQFRFFQYAGSSFTVSSLIINGTQQLTAPNPNPVVLPIPAATTPAATTPAATTPAWTTAFATTPASTTPARTTAYSTTAKPVFPRMTFKTKDMGNGRYVFVNEPYQKCDFFTVSFTVSAFSGEMSIFDIWSSFTSTEDRRDTYRVNQTNITRTGEYSFTQQNPTPERYNEFRFFQYAGSSFTVTSLIINGTQQLTAPNPNPLVLPIPAATTPAATTPAATTPAKTTASTTAQPVFPRMTFKTIDMGNGQHMFVNEPYQKCDFFTVSFTVSAFSGINSIFEIWSYHTNTYDHFNKSMIKLVNITSTGEYTFTQQNPTPERYNQFRFFQYAGSSFTVSSLIINGTQQLTAPNPNPVVLPIPAATTPAATTPAATTPAATTPAWTTAFATTPSATTPARTTPAATTPAATTPAWTTAFATTPASTTPARTTAYSTTAKPVFPLMTFKTKDMGNGRYVFVNEPYQKCDFFTVSFTVSAFSGEMSIFDIWSSFTSTEDRRDTYRVNQTNITRTGEYSFTQQNPTPQRYNEFRFFQYAGSSFTVTSLIINGTQQLTGPNPNPLVLPIPAATTPAATTPAWTTAFATTPASTTPARTTPAATTPAATTPAWTTAFATTPASTTPARTTAYSTTPAATTPAWTTAYATTPASTTPARTTAYSTTPARTTPARTTPARTTPSSTRPRRTYSNRPTVARPTVARPAGASPVLTTSSTHPTSYSPSAYISRPPDPNNNPVNENIKEIADLISYFIKLFKKNLQT